MPPELLAAGALAAAVAMAASLELRRRAELVVRACHEARRPLTAAHLVLATMGRDGEPTEALEAELRRTARALDDVTAASRGRVGPLGARELDARGVLAEVAAAWEAPARARGRRVVLGAAPVGLRLHGDPRRLGQALGNLVANALEHGGAQVELRAVLAGEGGGRQSAARRPRRPAATLRLEVLDDGPGLRAPVAALARRPRPDGRGRGLAIARSVARAHGGRLVAAPVARGTLLALELPLAGPPAGAGACA